MFILLSLIKGKLVLTLKLTTQNYWNLLNFKFERKCSMLYYAGLYLVLPKNVTSSKK